MVDLQVFCLPVAFSASIAISFINGEAHLVRYLSSFDAAESVPNSEIQVTPPLFIIQSPFGGTDIFNYKSSISAFQIPSAYVRQNKNDLNRESLSGGSFLFCPLAMPFPYRPIDFLTEIIELINQIIVAGNVLVIDLVVVDAEKIIPVLSLSDT